MADAYARKLFYHGAAVIWVGLLAGLPFGMVIMGRMPGDTRAWHMAHLEGILNGLLTIAAGAALGRLTLDERSIPLYARSFIVAAWGNVIASIFAAMVHQRGLELALPLTNLVVFVGFVIAIVAVLLGLYLMMRGSKEP
jgi:hypothetical protein